MTNTLAVTSAFVLTYEHQHGIDVSLHATRHGAHRYGFATMAEYAHDVCGAKEEMLAELREAVRKDDWIAAKRLWELMTDEFFVVEERDVDDDIVEVDPDNAFRSKKQFEVKLTNLEDGEVLFEVAGNGATSWAKEFDQSIAGSLWESEDSDHYAYAVAGDHSKLADCLSLEGYLLNLKDYTPKA